MNKTDIEKLRERLNWYIFECPFIEYNEQEVNYILEELKKNEDETERNIKSSHFSFDIAILRFNKVYAKKETNKSNIIASIGMIAIASSIMITVFGQRTSMAGVKSGVFYFINRNENKIQFITSPESEDKDVIYKVYSFEDIPDNLQGSVWTKNELLETYIISYIQICNNKINSVSYKDINSNKYINFYYNQQIEMTTNKYFIVDQFNYQSINVDHFQVLPVEIGEHIFSFSYMGDNFYIKTNNIDDINTVLYDFIDYVVND